MFRVLSDIDSIFYGACLSGKGNFPPYFKVTTEDKYSGKDRIY